MEYQRDRVTRRGVLRALVIGGSLLATALGLTVEIVQARGEPMIDIFWVNRFAPVRAAFNRDEASPVQVAFRADGAQTPVPVRWSITQGPTTIATRDTLIDAAPRGLDKVFTLALPPLAPGAYLLVLTADPEGTFDEKDEQNNAIAFPLRIPNGRAVRFLCNGPEGTSWDIQRIELNRGSGTPYPGPDGTKPDTSRTNEKEIVVNGIEPGVYTGVLFGASVNRSPILVSEGSFEMTDPPTEMTVTWPRTTPYLVSRPKVTGTATGGTLGNNVAAPQWEADTRVVLDGKVRNPTIRSEDLQWMLRFTDREGTHSAVLDTLLTLGALATETVVVTGRVPRDPGMYLIQAEVRVPWPNGFEDLGDEDRVNSHVLPLGWIEVLP